MRTNELDPEALELLADAAFVLEQRSFWPTTNNANAAALGKSAVSLGRRIRKYLEGLD